MNGLIYDICSRLLIEPKLVPLRKQLLGSLRGEIVAVGAGTGVDFPFFDSTAHVLALEPDEGMRRVAQRKLSSSRARIEILDADDTYMDRLPENTVDAVIFTLCLCSVSNAAETLARARQVLRPHGKIAVIEHVRSSGLLGRIEDFVTPAWRRLVGNCHLNRDSARTIARAGFDVSGFQTLPQTAPKIIYGWAYPKAYH